MQTLLQDLRYALRQLRQSPGFTVAAVLTLAIGIGLNTAGFSSMDAVVLHPLAVPEMDHVVTIAERLETGVNKRAALANFEDWKRQSRSFEALSVFTGADMSLTGAGEAAHVRTTLASGGFFSVLRAQALVGRVFGESECQPGHDEVAVLNYGYWQRQFAGDPAVLGRKVELDGRTYTIVGVMGKAMQYPSDTDIYLPFAPTPQQLENRSLHEYFVTGRLRQGVTVKQAQAEMRIVGERLAQAYPATNLGYSVRVEPLLDGINGELTPLYYRLVMGATLFVLLVVCANIANLQFARGIARRPEIAMRTALGASRSRIVRQLLTESILLGFLGAAGGLAVGWVYLRIILVTMPPRVARFMSGWSNTSLNGRVLAFSLLLAVATGVISGIAPAIQALRLNLVEQLKSGSRGSTGARGGGRLRSIFAVSQIALAVALVIGAALISKGMDNMLHLADGYEPGKILTFTVTLPQARYDTADKMAAWYAESLTKLRALPGVTHAEVATALPYSDNAWLQDCAIENRPAMPGKFQSALRLTVSDSYFGAFRVPIVSGRGFAKSDALGSQPVAVVSRRFAEQYFPAENALGRKIQMGGQANSHEPWLTIVGIAAETSYSTWEQAVQPAVYLDAAQMPAQVTTYAILTDGDPLALAAPARKALAGMDAALPLDMVMTYRQYLHELLMGLIYAAAMLAVDAVIALLLAALGIFGVMANLVGERSREIGVRLAMGARREDVVKMILRRAAWLTGIGVGAGLLLAFGLAHGVANLLRGVSPNDPVVFTAITTAIVGVALVASWFPARRASRIDPMVALRDE
jgi:predicted permease